VVNAMILKTSIGMLPCKLLLERFKMRELLKVCQTGWYGTSEIVFFKREFLQQCKVANGGWNGPTEVVSVKF